MIENLFCSNCRRIYPIDQRIWRCDCESPLDLKLSPQFQIKEILKRKPNLWRYREALPILHDDSIISMGEGFTPLEEMELDGHQILVKVDYLFPTGSYKDRGATVLISKLRELGIERVIEDSSGNAGSAIAAYCTRAGIKCEIFVPQSTSSGKLAQIEAYGAILKRIEGSREKTAEMAMEASKKTYYASHCWNPFFLHGTKTFAFEIWEQLGWKSPDTLVLPVGHGTLLLGAYLGFKELKEAGKIERIPRLIAIQSAACSPIYKAFKKGTKDIPSIEKKVTVAEGIAIAKPVRGRQIIEAIRETKGEVIIVTEREILSAQKIMALRGHFIEFTASATIAGLKRYLRERKKGEIVVSSLTGMGLKSIKA